MINPTELRIGNIIADHHGDEVSVVAVSGKELSLQFEDMIMSGIDPDLCEPIPLTPEWLERCNGDWKSEEIIYSIQVGNSLYLEIDTDFNCGTTPETWPDSIIRAWGEAKYVHQLQNLYFALTGEELTINHEHIQSTS